MRLPEITVFQRVSLADAYISRVRAACECLDSPLRVLRDRCRDDFHADVSTLVLPTTVRYYIDVFVALNLYSLIFQAENADVRPSYDGDECVRLPEHIELLLCDYLRFELLFI